MKNLFKQIISSLIVCFLFTFAHATDSCPNYPHIKPETGPLASINCVFHQAYDSRTDEILKTFGAPGGRPIILNLGGNLVFMHNGQTETVNAAPDQFHLIKAFAHALFATNLILEHLEDGLLSTDTRDQLISLQSHLMQSVSEIDNMPLKYEEKMLIKNLTQHHLEYINQLIISNYFEKAKLRQFFAKHQDELENVIKLDVVIQLAIIDQTINRWLERLTRIEQAELGVVVATVHQARAQELSLLYFMKKFHFKYGEGAQYENGFVVLEGKFDKASALKLLAHHYLDRKAAAMIFNDPERLQSDLLGPATNAILGL